MQAPCYPKHALKHPCTRLSPRQVWAGMEGGTFQGLKVNITLKWSPGDAAADPLLEPVTGNPLEGSGPLVARALPPGAAPAPAAASPAPAAAPAADAGKAGVAELSAVAPAADAGCAARLSPWDQCGGTTGACSKYTDGCKDAPFAGACCPDGYKCARSTVWYWQCVPADKMHRLSRRRLRV